MHAALRKRLAGRSLNYLRRLRGDVDALIAELERGPQREVDIAASFTGDPRFVAKVIRVEGVPDTSMWYQVRIYCSLEHCTSCPHGDYGYRYRRNKRRRTVTVEYVGKSSDRQVRVRLTHSSA